MFLSLQLLLTVSHFSGSANLPTCKCSTKKKFPQHYFVRALSLHPGFCPTPDDCDWVKFPDLALALRQDCLAK